MFVSSWSLGSIWGPHYLPEVAHNRGGPGPEIPQGSNVPTSSLGKMMGTVHDAMDRCIEGAGLVAERALFCGTTVEKVFIMA